MTRSVWKGPFVDSYVIKKVVRAKAEGGAISSRPIRIWSRRSVIIPDFVGFTFQVHNGKKFIPVHVVEEMVGHKFGEFSPTRVFHGHAGDRKVKK